MYIINVTRFGHHVFAAECRCASREQAERIYALICERFPEPEYGITLMWQQTYGQHLLDRPLAVPRRNTNEV